MDYCLPCRRHLNGALACAGCGTPADQVTQPPPGPLGQPGPPGPGRGFNEGVDGAEVIEWDQVPPRRAPARRGATAPPRTAARRARTRRGRKALIGGVGLALAAGALGFFELTGDDDGAATAVKESARTETEPAPEPSTEGESPKRPAEVIEPPATRGAPVPQRPTDPTTRSRAERGGGPSPTGPASRTATSPPAPTPKQPSATAGPSGSTRPGQPRVSPPPLPEPAPSESCERFLWWCV
ncbi:SCO2400 family protein [Streptomyces albipurpureus]|uniref:Serine/threonine protein kinase n=1 Tax=Streptomyces albipurpureus TaxID=2897419 RepID=A0ABT0UJ09_9ACTN|nr:hypothetical protein [Streptomyces sp. CWNU-1]MCM2388624.1 hypothetical protein [Streptomyces sp. CWNU-1]